MEDNGSHEFLNLDISLDKGKFLYEMYESDPLTSVLLECHQLQVVFHFFIAPLCQNL